MGAKVAASHGAAMGSLRMRGGIIRRARYVDRRQVRGLRHEICCGALGFSTTIRHRRSAHTQMQVDLETFRSCADPCAMVAILATQTARLMNNGFARPVSPLVAYCVTQRRRPGLVTRLFQPRRPLTHCDKPRSEAAGSWAKVIQNLGPSQSRLDRGQSPSGWAEPHIGRKDPIVRRSEPNVVVISPWLAQCYALPK